MTKIKKKPGRVITEEEYTPGEAQAVKAEVMLFNLYVLMEGVGARFSHGQALQYLRMNLHKNGLADVYFDEQQGCLVYVLNGRGNHFFKAVTS